MLPKTCAVLGGWGRIYCRLTCTVPATASTQLAWPTSQIYLRRSLSLSPSKPVAVAKSEGESPVKSKRRRAALLESDEEGDDIPTVVKLSTAGDHIEQEPINIDSESPSSIAVPKPPAKCLSVQAAKKDKQKKTKDSECSSKTKSELKAKPFFKTMEGSLEEEAVTESKPCCCDPDDYNPDITDYHPVRDACWRHGEKVPYLAIARTFLAVENTSSRLKIISLLSNFLRSVVALTPQDLEPCVYLCLNKVAPAYEGVELGIGDGVLLKAVAACTGQDMQQIKSILAEKGDLGLVAESCRINQRTMFAPACLTVSLVFSKLLDIAQMSGSAAMSRKVSSIQGMFAACRGCEARYLIRSLSGKLRIGLAEQSVLVALGHTVVLTPPSADGDIPKVLDTSKKLQAEALKQELDAAAQAVKTAFCELPSYGVLTAALLKHGWSKLSSHCSITPGIPIKPMLAHPTTGINDILHRLGASEFACEYKYDGERAQIHLDSSGKVQVFSRNQENTTSKYPDVISVVKKVIPEGVTSIILDSEAVAWDQEKQQILPFQVLSTRKRKDADSFEIKVKVCVYAFDLLYLNGESLVSQPFRSRRDVLRSLFPESPGEFMLTRSVITADVDRIQEFLEESLKGSCEGLMIKTLDVDATYEIAKRSRNWLKLKKDYLDGVGDTLDLVVIGGYLGTGKRTGRYGGFLLACYDPDTEEYQSICKIGTGFSDEDLVKLHAALKDHIIDKPRSYYRYSESLAADHWFETSHVWEVRAADLSLSPVHYAAAGLVDETRGISLRFPRFLRVRDDKKPEEVTDSRQVADMYRSQESVKNSTSRDAAPEEDDEDS